MTSEEAKKVTIRQIQQNLRKEFDENFSKIIAEHADEIAVRDDRESELSKKSQTLKLRYSRNKPK